MSWEILGHQWAVDLLKSHVANDRLRHAYLLTGPDGIGRRTLALRFAQALNCPEASEPGIPCGSCTTCRQIAAMEHPDLSLLQAEDPGGILKVDQVRDIQRSLNLSPYDAKYRVGLILDFEKANPNAANALLKTLEEPPPKVVLLLTAESAEGLLPTIVSRCEVIRLRPLPLKRVQRGLIEHWDIEQEHALFLAHISGGRPGYAIQLNNNTEMLEARSQSFDDLDRLLHAPLVDRMAYAQLISSSREDISSVLMGWSTLFRDVMLVTAGSHTPLTNIDLTERIHSYAKSLDLNHIHQYIKQLEDTMDMVKRYVNPRLATEILLMDLPNI